MLLRFKYIWFTVVLIFVCGLNANADNMTDSLLSRYRSYLISSDKPEATDKLVATLNENGMWADIDYKDRTRGNWRTLEHISRLYSMAFAWASPANPAYHNKPILNAIALGLKHWYTQHYQNPNWWYNEIGVPLKMQQILVLLKGALPDDVFKHSLDIVAQVRIRGTGANLTWTAAIGMHYGALTGDMQKIDSCSKLLINEVVVSTGEGIQPDYSFHQHAARLQNFHYGSAFLADNARMAWELRGTPWAYPDNKVQILVDMILKGDQWMERGTAISPGTIDRAISRPGFLHNGDLSSVIDLLAVVKPAAAASLRTIKLRYKDDTKPLTGFRYFPYSDFAAYHTSGFSFFLKTISTRTLPAEINTNSENVKGRLLNSGDTYFIKNGDEYFDIMPAWDWDRIPGVTNFGQTRQTSVKRLKFNGSVSDSVTGLSAMDYLIKDSINSFSAHKIWASHGNVVICLMSNIETNVSSGVFTTLNQCALQGPVVVNKAGNELAKGNHHINNVRWIYHSGFAYIPLGKSVFNITNNTVAGSWSNFNLSLPYKSIDKNVFMPVMLHDQSTTGYVIASCKTAAEASSICKSPSWKVIQNDGNCQAVMFKDNLLMAAFFDSGSVKAGNINIKVDRPCLIIKNGSKLSVSDPSHTGGVLLISIDNSKYTIQLSDKGYTQALSLK
jgi:chondroitin AC lyase